MATYTKAEELRFLKLEAQKIEKVWAKADKAYLNAVSDLAEAIYENKPKTVKAAQAIVKRCAAELRKIDDYASRLGRTIKARSN